MLRKIAIVLWLLVGLFVIAFFGVMWWDQYPPKRPPELPESAVWLRAPNNPLPEFKKRGEWVGCWQDVASGRNRCRFTESDGTLIYEGEFVPYGSDRPMSAEELQIVPEKSREAMVWVDSKIVWLIYLHNGTTLVPANEYEVAPGVRERLKDR